MEDSLRVHHLPGEKLSTLPNWYIVSDHSYDGAYPWHEESFQDLQAVPANVLDPRPQGDHIDQQPGPTMAPGN